MRVKKEKIKKYIRNLLIVVIGSYVLATAISAVMMTQMTRITYNTSGFGVTSSTVDIDFNTNTAQLNYYNWEGELTDNKVCTIDSKEKIKIKAICTLSLFPLWRKSYDNWNILDGEQWNMVRGYKSKDSTVYGSNAYPLTYQFVWMAIHDIFE